jgi:chromosome transmission fidelity protein 18
MSGPPGFGKTTLAHVIAKQAGYNIIEINASDDRTGEVVRSKIKSALEMQAIIRESSDTGKMTMTQKPNLLIIDEIDGASSGGGADVNIALLFILLSSFPKKRYILYIEFY